MPSPDLLFAIPTYRLRDVGVAVEAYDENFYRNGHTTPICVFDDSSPANHDKHYGALERSRTHNELWYVGPAEKERFLAHLTTRLRDRRLDLLVKTIFRPSYGGNRNYTLMYSLGGLLVSSDDDMRPWGLMDPHAETLADGEVAHGRLVRAEPAPWVQKSYDILAAFRDVLGLPASDVPPNYLRGEALLDSAMELETNTSVGPLAHDNSLTLAPGELAPDATVKLAQSFRCGTNDLDALDFAEIFLENDAQLGFDDLTSIYILTNFRPALTKKNWRMDCGVAGYDNCWGLPPFFPTRLRFEDYIHRLWVQQPGVVAAHVPAAQSHTKNPYMRQPLAAEILNEEVANLLKRKIKSSLTRLDEFGIHFGYDGEVGAADTAQTLDKITSLHGRVLRAAAAAEGDRAKSLHRFAASLEKTFCGFEPDLVQHSLAGIADGVTSVIKGAIEVWPSLLEIAYFESRRRGLPRTRVHNQST